MARTQRLNVSGGIYHVMLRGNDGQDIFYGNEDRCHLYLLLLEGAERFGYRVHAFCFMNNHLHLVIQIGTITLAKIMQNLSFRYTQWVNFRRERSGHLFQGRYTAILVDADSYLLELVRYVHLNPVRAGLVEKPETWRWSGHRSYLGMECIPWLCTDCVLSQFGETVSDARIRYAKFIQAALGEEDWGHGAWNNGERSGFPPDSFLQDVLREEDRAGNREPPALPLVVGTICAEYDATEAELIARGKQRYLAEARATVGLIAVELGAATLTEVARLFQRDVATLSSSVQKLERRRKVNEAVQEKIEKLKLLILGQCHESRA